MYILVKQRPINVYHQIFFLQLNLFKKTVNNPRRLIQLIDKIAAFRYPQLGLLQTVQATALTATRATAAATIRYLLLLDVDVEQNCAGSPSVPENWIHC